MQMNWQNIVTTAEQKFQVRKCDYCNINTLCYSIYLTRLYFALNFFVVSLVCIFRILMTNYGYAKIIGKTKKSGLCLVC
jgi:hypothetical protein